MYIPNDCIATCSDISYNKYNTYRYYVIGYILNT